MASLLQRVLPLQLSAIFDCHFEVVYLNGIKCTLHLVIQDAL